jgi:hypothetical protein
MAYISIQGQIRQLSQDEGLKDHEIARIIGCSRATVCRSRKKYNIPTANLKNRKDKTFVCRKCGVITYIQRREHKRYICDACKGIIPQKNVVQ